MSAVIANLNSAAPFERYLLCWRLLGVRADGRSYGSGIWEHLLTVLITIGYPLHLILGLMHCETMHDTFSNLVVSVGIIAVSIRIINYRLRLRQMRKVHCLMKQLDERIRHRDESEYLQEKILPKALRLVNMFYLLYGLTVIMSVLAFIISEEKRLLYPGWFPYDWKRSSTAYFVSAFYQCWGFSVEAVQALANDVYGPMSLCIFAGHVRMLKMRLARIGYDNLKSEEMHNEELIACIEDYEVLMRILHMLQETLSLSIFIQFLFGGLSIGVAMIYILFYMNDFFTLCYNLLQLTVFLGQLFPCCYFGSLVESEFQNLPYAIFCCNWPPQKRNFRRNAKIFAQLTLRSVTSFAGGMIRIHIDSFFATCKMAYSFFTLMITMK